MSRSAYIFILAGAAWAGGCGTTNREFATPQRLESGLVILLPGIEGEGPMSYSVRAGLVKAGVPAGLPIYRWGRPVPLAGPLINQMDFLGNRLMAERIADYIVAYQDGHPGRAVYLVGHSGGGGLAVMAAEALPAERSVEGLVLLSASISSGYDLRKALARCRQGIVNYSSRGDVALLMVATTVAGNVDGAHGPAAGAIGFSHAYPTLYERPWHDNMARAGHDGGHTGATAARFVQEYVAPWLLAGAWPAR